MSDEQERKRSAQELFAIQKTLPPIGTRKTRHGLDWDVKAAGLDESTLQPRVALLCRADMVSWDVPLDVFQSPNLFDLIYSAKERMRHLAIHVEAGWPPFDIHWQHYKGGKYEVLSTSPDLSTLALRVMYRSLELGLVWNRPLYVFTEIIDVGKFRRPRFVPILPEAKTP